ncbi:MAG TPA: hypothetical protein VGJ86_17685 [Acidimicrobiales bacterium]|jgi:hypothetical protein
MRALRTETTSRPLAIVAATLAATVVAVIGFGGTAWAKGPQSASITGPGLDEPIELTMQGGDGNQIVRLMALSGVWEGSETGGPERLSSKPTGDLGSKYTVIWSILVPNNDGQLEDRVAYRKDIYPDAAGGPVIYTPAQEDTGVGVGTTGWARGTAGLWRVLGEVGVPVADRPVPSTPEAPAGDPWWVPGALLAGALGLVVVLGLGAVVARSARAQRAISLG